MKEQMRVWRYGVLLLAALAHGAILAPFQDMRFIGATVLVWVLPGLALLEWADPDTQSDLAERLGLSIALSFAITSITLLIAHYLPGPLTCLQVLLAADLPIAFFFCAAWLCDSKRLSAKGLTDLWLPPVTFGFLSIIVLASFYRFTWLGYSEFQGDEALVTWASARAIGGEDDVLFLHGKSPSEVLAPASLWVLNGRLNEAQARGPFALASLAAVWGAYLIGRRFFSPRVGIAAALLFALNGYFIGFARVVQYQSLVILLSLFAVYAALCAAENQRPTYVPLSALLLGGALLAHYDGLLAGPVVLGAWLWTRRSARVRLRLVLFSLILPIGIAALYYGPFACSAQFGQMASYLSGSRIGATFLNNNILLLFNSMTVYNSSYYTAALMILLLGLIAWLWPSRAFGYAVAIILLGALVTTVVWPRMWQMGRVNLAMVPYALLLGLALAFSRSGLLRALWLWFAVTFLAYVFVLAHPLSHVYMIMPAWLILAALASDHLLAWMQIRLSRKRTAQVAMIVVLVVLVVVFGGYPYAAFVSHQPEFRQAYFDRPVPGYWRPYGQLPGVGKFGFPHRSGWKALGYLFDTAGLQGDYLSNEEEWVGLWYTHFAPRSCRPDARYYFVARNAWDPVDVPQRRLEQEYTLIGRIAVEGDPRINVYARKSTNPSALLGGLGESPVLDVGQFEAAFDAAATPDRFVQRSVPNHTLEVRFGETVTLLGYDLVGEGRPGNELDLTLYWRAERPILDRFHVFVQLGDERVATPLDSEPVCGRLPTSLWRPGQVVVDRHRIDVRDNAPSGLARLVTGMYLPEAGRWLVPEARNDGKGRVMVTEINIERN